MSRGAQYFKLCGNLRQTKFGSAFLRNGNSTEQEDLSEYFTMSVHAYVSNQKSIITWLIKASIPPQVFIEKIGHKK